MSQEQNQITTPLPCYTITILGTKLPQVLTIPGRLPGLNEYTDTCRTNPRAGARMKRDAQETVMWHILSQLRRVKFQRPVFLLYHFYEQDRRRDKDNVSGFAHKVIQDALVAAGTLEDDGWKHVTGSLDQYDVDSENPRIVVEFIEEVGTCSKQPGKSSKK